jgi:hypothetical protein
MPARLAGTVLRVRGDLERACLCLGGVAAEAVRDRVDATVLNTLYARCQRLLQAGALAAPRVVNETREFTAVYSLYNSSL